ncbi:MAG TPA: transcriptional repressor [Cytophagales bacterium]|nr:transcriptional repressor [Cytophagales bacterium]
MITLSLEEIKTKLAEKGLKSTQQRIVIYNSVYHSESHPCAENIYEEVKLDNPSISLATVYKTLDTLIDAGLVNRVLNEDGTMRYDANLNSHNHIYCTNTREIIDYEDPELSQLIQNYFESKQINNLKIKEISVQINGEKLKPTQAISIK